uniref:Transglutaminase N-terminal domain-containing protein n=1 Tax=Hucho hucho TaxID=62062 RepID=A0A4W5JX89_9TELE
MPGERLMGSCSEVGRFHGNALTIVESKSKEQGGCLQCFQEIFCCSRRQSSLYDVTDTVVRDEVVKPPQPHTGDKELEELMLSVHSVDLLSSKTGQNRLEHHTNLYHGNKLIIRRGQTFQIELDLSRPFNSNTDKLHLDLRTGKSDLDVCHKKAIVLYSLVQYVLCKQHYIIQCGVVGQMCPAVSQAPVSQAPRKQGGNTG